MIHRETVDVETIFGTLFDVPVEYYLVVEEYPAEPYSWGEGRGMVIEHEIRILTLADREATSLDGFLGIDLNLIKQDLEGRHDT